MPRSAEAVRTALKFWWTPPVLTALLILAKPVSYLDLLPTLPDIVLGVLAALVLPALPVLWVLLLIRGKWVKCLLSVGLTFLVVVLLLPEAAIIAMAAPRSDDFGKAHPVPDGLDYHVPARYPGGGRIDRRDKSTFLQVTQCGQGGNYAYDFWFGPLPAGEIFLRCHEVTEGIPLSEERIRESSSVRIGSTRSFGKLVNRQEFTIFEGDWGDFYAARIEVWHRNGATGGETKLAEKIFLVEGWQR